MAKDLSKDLINLQILHSILDSDLDKSFRSEIFSKKKVVDSKELSRGIIQDRQSFPTHSRRESLVPKRRASINQGIISSEIEDWKSMVPDSTLQWLQGKVYSATNATPKSDSSEDLDIINLKQE
jgi:hypothetical protein